MPSHLIDVVSTDHHTVKPGTKNSSLREREGEWKKVVLVAPGGRIDAIDRSSLEGCETDGLERVEAFLGVCEAVEGGLTNVGDCGSTTSSSSILVCKTLPVDEPSGVDTRKEESIGLIRKLRHLGHSTTTPTASTPSMGWNRGRRELPFEPPSLTQQTGGFETRFIPSVGWCVRYAGPSSGGAGKYRMMFFDGKTLEVDVDEECVELVDSVRDEIVRLVPLTVRISHNTRISVS